MLLMLGVRECRYHIRPRHEHYLFQTIAMNCNHQHSAQDYSRG